MTLKEKEFYCLRCKKYVVAEEGSICKTSYINGRPGAKGICPKCKGKLSKIVGKKTSRIIKKNYNDCPLKSDKSVESESNTIVEVGGIVALLSLLAGGIAVTVKSLKNC